VLGRYDRAWGPERPIFGKIRYMTSENTAKKLKLTNYLQKYGSPSLKTRKTKASLFD
jgi:deoxyribodipyrimidine photo-lyase